MFKAIANWMFILPAYALSGPIDARGSSEHVLLCNCVDAQGSLSSLMGYYGDTPSGQPAAVAITATGRTTIWEGAQQTGTFSDGNTFTSNIDSPVAEGAYAGSGQNQFGSFSCYHKYQPNFFTLGDSTVCSSIYDCNHTPPPENQVKIFYSINGQSVEISSINASPAAILNNVWSRRAESIVDETPVDLGGGCQIVFRGRGDDSWTTMNGLSTVLMDQVATQPTIAQIWETESRHCSEFCEPPSPPNRCCGWDTTTIQHTKMAQSVSIIAYNTASNSDRGELSYAISCPPPPGVDCGLTKAFGVALGAAALAPGIGLAFGVIGVIFGGIRSIGPC